MDNGTIESAEARLEKAESKLRQATRTPPRESNEHPSSVLTGSQRCIEHCAKAIFILMGVHEPSEHAISVESEESRQLLNSVVDELDEEYALVTARILFLTELYGNTYPVSEYGISISQMRMEADDFLDRMEGSQAYNHAVDVVEQTRAMLDVARERNGMAQKQRDDIIGSAYEQW